MPSQRRPPPPPPPDDGTPPPLPNRNPPVVNDVPPALPPARHPVREELQKEEELEEDIQSVYLEPEDPQLLKLIQARKEETGEGDFDQTYEMPTEEVEHSSPRPPQVMGVMLPTSQRGHHFNEESDDDTFWSSDSDCEDSNLVQNGGLSSNDEYMLPRESEEFTQDAYVSPDDVSGQDAAPATPAIKPAPPHRKKEKEASPAPIPEPSTTAPSSIKEKMKMFMSNSNPISTNNTPIPKRNNIAQAPLKPPHHQFPTPPKPSPAVRTCVTSTPGPPPDLPQPPIPTPLATSSKPIPPSASKKPQPPAKPPKPPTAVTSAVTPPPPPPKHKPDQPPALPPNHPRRGSNCASDDSGSAGSLASISGGQLPLRGSSNDGKFKAELTKAISKVSKSNVTMSQPQEAVGGDVYTDGASEPEPHPFCVYDWFHEDATKQNATERVTKLNMNGGFLVRQSTQGSVSALETYTLVVLSEGNIYNLQIKQRSDGNFAIGSEKPDEKRFDSVNALIQHHLQFNISLSKGGSVKLTKPAPKTRR